MAAVACGGSAKEPETPLGGSSEKAEQPATEAPSASSGDSSAETKGESKADTAASGPSAPESSPVRSAKDVLLKPDVLYVFSFTSSEPHQAAEKQCKQSSHEDPKKMSECMSAASKRVEQDALAFQTDADGKYWWLTVRRKGGSLVTLHRIGFDIDKDSDKKVVLKPRGPDKGSKPLGAIPRELVVEVEGESAIAIDDPKLGHLVYEAKLGLLGSK